jgi:hypothetical protein
MMAQEGGEGEGMKCQCKGCNNEVGFDGDLACQQCLRELEGWLELMSVGKEATPDSGNGEGEV